MIQVKRYSPEMERISKFALMRGAGWGMIGGLVATAVMDLVLIGSFWAAGMPLDSCFTLVGDTVAQFFTLQGSPLAGGAPLGVAAHYLIGPLFGVIFGLLVVGVKAFHLHSLKKGILLAVLFAEIFSQPLLAATPILLGADQINLALWFGGSFIMHMLWGVILGAVVSRNMLIAFR